MSQQQALAALREMVGKEIHESPGIEVTPGGVQAFAHATGDHQWIHTDHERTTREAPYGSPIAHSYLILSLYPMLRGLVAEIKEGCSSARTARWRSGTRPSRRVWPSSSRVCIPELPGRALHPAARPVRRAGL